MASARYAMSDAIAAAATSIASASADGRSAALLLLPRELVTRQIENVVSQPMTIELTTYVQDRVEEVVKIFFGKPRTTMTRPAPTYILPEGS
jgi:hypothetical protein